MEKGADANNGITTRWSRRRRVTALFPFAAAAQRRRYAASALEQAWWRLTCASEALNR